ncbi:hypothetical protein CR513_20419, partial [Mucuna pruriens]
MEAYLETLDLWEAIEEDYEVLPLPDNPTMAQIKNHKEKKNPKSKGKTMIMTLKSAKAINLMREFELQRMKESELQRMKESETMKEYSDKLLSIANKIRLLGSDFVDSRIVEKILGMLWMLHTSHVPFSHDIVLDQYEARLLYNKVKVWLLVGESESVKRSERVE